MHKLLKVPSMALSDGFMISFNYCQGNPLMQPFFTAISIENLFFRDFDLLPNVNEMITAMIRQLIAGSSPACDHRPFVC
jgi:hypothetical protein